MAMRCQTLVVDASTSAMASANGDGCCRGALRRLGSAVGKEEAGAAGAQWVNPYPGSRWRALPEGEFGSRWKGGWGDGEGML